MKYPLLTTTILATMLLGVVACDKKPAQPQKEKPTTVATNKTEDFAVAYVEIDTILTQYQYCIDKKGALEAKGKQFEAQIAAKMTQLEKAANAFQQKLQKGGFASQQEAEGEQRRIQQMQQQGAQLEQQLQKKMMEEQEAFNRVLRDSVQSFLKDYNKAKGFKMILTKQGDNILLADDKLDITQEVVDGLNKRYKK